ncbi:DLH domain-containing protein [Mycena indigotica]|uniref:DLH domain-containing protein n=1 Tax=Mycena indigotica TaxID=2126181 RepID=A0A8H6S4L1_9AGAR|nr:DLH domain-containing protein [Mycena indigotica]KAF7291205.1 DLH domain-containing protein [Mycena indigotica]
MTTNSTDAGFCADCFKGVRHEGTPEGAMTTLGGVPCYVATPAGEYDATKAVLYLSDACGLALPNNKLLADDYARNGYKTVVPDLFAGDPVPPTALDPDAPPFDWQAWLPQHQPAHTGPLLDAVLAALTLSGVTHIACAGYCFGARAALDLALAQRVSPVALAHPSQVRRGPSAEDAHAYAATAAAPLLIVACEHDPVFPPADQAITDAILGGGRFAPGYKRVYFPGCRHGFAVRGDPADPAVRAAKKAAFKEMVGWFRGHGF